jgi:hypothetical protein
MNELLPYAVMLDSLIVAYIQCLIMLIGLKKVLNQELMCLCGKTATVLSELTIPNTVDADFLLFYCISSKYIV